MGKSRCTVVSGVFFLVFAILVGLGWQYASNHPLIQIVFPPANAPDWEAIKMVKNDYSVEIIRDEWGVPHIYGKRDADVSFGLAFAHAEDDFAMIQQQLLAGRGTLAQHMGPKGAIIDYFRHLLRADQRTHQHYFVDYTNKTRRLLEAYASGLNYYAAKHPEQVLLPESFPVNGRDVVVTSTLIVSLFSKVDKFVKSCLLDEDACAAVKWTGGHYNRNFAKPQKASDDTYYAHMDGGGSNAFALSSKKTADGSTFLAINSHQPFEGPVSWYEVALHSEEGLNAQGGVFPGAPVVLHGHTDKIAWAHTVNCPDNVDVYELTMHPFDPERYLFDGEYRSLEKQTVPIRMKLFGPFYWTIHMNVYWSVYGPTIKNAYSGKFYSIWFGGIDKISPMQQWYQINLSNDMEEFEEVMSQNNFPMFHTLFADHKHNIAYYYSALLPNEKQTNGIDRSHLLPGNTSATLWTEYVPWRQLPHVRNPSSGFLQNCNNSPYHTTCSAPVPPLNESLKVVAEKSASPTTSSQDKQKTRNWVVEKLKEMKGNIVEFVDHMHTELLNSDTQDNPVCPEHYNGIETGITGRSWRALELFSSDPSISLEEFIEYKYDMQYSDRSAMGLFQLIVQHELIEIPEELQQDQLFNEALRLVRNWNLRVDPHNTEATLAVLSWAPFVWIDFGLPDFRQDVIEQPDILYRRLFDVAKMLKRKFGTLEVEYQELNRLVRGDVDVGLGGGVDVLHAIIGIKLEERLGDPPEKMKAWVGDSYIHIVQFLPNGTVTSDNIHQFGSATTDASSPHYNDQSEMFARRQLKRAWRTKEELEQHAKRIYTLGK